ncbi:hypothetical protein PAHAL_9G546100 [Panicum hallii]|jgi:hypothetical protein|uniref:Uncharacterized protein n=1 Tax=Panicum hallii TaxID=206008 RepID=A0A2T8I5R6_9POAL|nr:hypothetical protein PAHAL_9G546100 [Panicum hallii]
MRWSSTRRVAKPAAARGRQSATARGVPGLRLRLSPCAPGPALQETRRGSPARARARGPSGPAVSSAPAAAPTASGSGTWPAFIDRARKQGSPVWRPDRAQARATPRPGLRRAVGAERPARSRCVRHGGTGTGSAPHRQGAAARHAGHGGRKRGTALRRCVRACLARFLVSLPGSPGGTALTAFPSPVRARGHQFPRSWRGPPTPADMYTSPPVPGNRPRFIESLRNRAPSVRYKYK